MEKKLIKILESICSLLLIVLIVVVSARIIAREFLHSSAAWTTEIGRLAFTAIVFFGTPILISEGRQMAVSLLRDALRKKKLSSLLLNIVCDIFTYFFIVTFAYGALGRTLDEWTTKIPTVEWLTYGYIYLLAFLGALCMIFMQVLNTKRYVMDYYR